MLIEALGTARDLGRLHDIAGVLIRHGLGDMVRRVGLAETLEKAGRALRFEQTAELAKLEPPVQVRRAMEELGPNFVKLGQMLEGRDEGVVLGNDQAVRLLDRIHDRVDIERLDRPRVDHLDRDVELLLYLLRRLESHRDSHRTCDDRAVLTLTLYISDAQRDGEILILGHLALHSVHPLLLHKDHRIIVADR